METDRYWGVHYRYCLALRGSISRSRGNGTTGDDYCGLGKSGGRGGLTSFLRVVADDFSIRRRGGKPLEEREKKKHLIDLFVFLLQRRHGRAALLPALEQLPVEYDVGVSPAPADRGLRRRHPGVQRSLIKGAQGRPVYATCREREKDGD